VKPAATWWAFGGPPGFFLSKGEGLFNEADRSGRPIHPAPLCRVRDDFSIYLNSSIFFLSTLPVSNGLASVTPRER
jgi:hypothetical protein